MAKVILFGGGEAGGLWVSTDGVTPIPPFHPGLRHQLRSVSALLRAERDLSPEEARRQLGGLINRLTNLAVGQVEGTFGPLDEEYGLIYQDDEGGFSCGSTGKPPMPFLWPPTPLPGIEELIRRGALVPDVLEFVAEAADAGADLSTLFRDPGAEATRLGLAMPERAEQQIKSLNVAELEKIEDPVDREVVEFFHRAVADGTHLDEWATRPFDVAKALDFDLSRDAAARIVAASGMPFPGRAPDTVMIKPLIVVIVVIVIVVASVERQIPVIDRSGVEKF
jgi:hypothetical protein